jgi:hypothetical protein
MDFFRGERKRTAEILEFSSEDLVFTTISWPVLKLKQALRVAFARSHLELKAQSNICPFRQCHFRGQCFKTFYKCNLRIAQNKLDYLCPLKAFRA